MVISPLKNRLEPIFCVLIGSFPETRRWSLFLRVIVYYLL
jgi:hypothetical protein